jgi:hypothetical protein
MLSALTRVLVKLWRRVFPYPYRPGDIAYFGEEPVIVRRIAKGIPNCLFPESAAPETLLEISFVDQGLDCRVPICEVRPATTEEKVAWRLRQ